MSTLILLEWSLSMFEPVINWDPSIFPVLERVTQTSGARTLNIGVAGLSLTEQASRCLSLPLRLDVAMTAIKHISTLVKESTSVVNGLMEPEPTTFATFSNLLSLSSDATSYEEFEAQIMENINMTPPTNVSYVILFQILRSLAGTSRTPLKIIIFLSSSKNLVATHEFLFSDQAGKLLPLPSDTFITFVPVPRGISESQSSLEFCRSVISLNKNFGRICSCSKQSLELFFKNLYRPFFATLKLGEINGRVQLIPNPASVLGGSKKISEEIQILGLMERNAVDKLYPTHPYFVIPSSNHPDAETADLLLEPHFATLLHASLKSSQGKVVLVSVASNWYGFMETVEDTKTKKRSALTLNLFPSGSSLAPGQAPVLVPGQSPVLVPGQSPVLVPGQAPVLESPDSLDLSKHSEDTPSYSSRDFSPVWTGSEAVQGDLGRIVRIARKLPDKLETFYKEVNKFRLHALSTCNITILKFLSELLTRECHQAVNTNASAELVNVLTQIKAHGFCFTGSLRASDGKVYPLFADL